jgi:hypothetical protein
VATVDLSRAFPITRVEMGDLVLASPPLIAEGRVVDGAGQPVEGALVRPTEARLGASSAEPFFVRCGDIQARSDAGGAFRLAGRTHGGRLRLELEHASLAAEPLEITPGTRDVELVALQTGGLAGRVLMESDISWWVHARRGAAGSRTPTVTPQREADGSFLFESLLPGAYTLSVSISGETLVEIDDLAVTSGEITRDPRIQELDLRGRLHDFTFVLVPPQPSTELSGTVHFSPAGRGEPERREFFRGGSVTVASSERRIDATLRVQGFHVERLTVEEPRTEVGLRPGYEVVLVLPPDVELPGRGARLGATLGELDFFGRSSTFDERREVRCTAYEAGRTRVHWFLERYTADSMNRSGLMLSTEHHVDVRDVEGEQRFELPVTNADLAAALTPR